MSISFITISVMRRLFYKFRNRHTEFVTQLPFKLKLAMPPTDRGNRGYSDEYIAAIKKES